MTHLRRLATVGLLTALMMAGCGPSAEQQRIQSSRELLELSLTSGDIAATARAWDMLKADLYTVEAMGKTLPDGTVAQVRATLRDRVQTGLEAQWPAIKKRDLAIIWSHPHALPPPPSREEGLIDAMLDDIGDPKLTILREDLKETRARALVEVSRGKVLFIDTNKFSSELDDCVKSALVPLFPGKTFQPWHQDPSEAVVEAAAGVVRVRTKMDFTTYTQENSPSQRPQAHVPTGLSLAVSAVLPDGATREWAVNTSASVPDKLRDKREANARAMGSIQTMGPAACSLFREELSK